jgi:hypothetical protein
VSSNRVVIERVLDLKGQRISEGKEKVERERKKQINLIFFML